LGKLWLSSIELQPVGKPEQTTVQKFVTLMMPLDKGAPPPKIETDKHGLSRLIHPDGTIDEIVLGRDDKLTVTRRKAGHVVARFPNSEKDAASLTEALKTNSDASAKRLVAGLKPVLDQIASERDAWTSKGRKNLALSAKITSSATRDERFAASRVMDNQTAEFPTDGHLDYSLGIVWSSGRFVGYGSAKESLLAGRDYWPLYVKPTYWLLPEETLGWIELELNQPTAVDTVRLLNTSNAGLNDFAAHTFRVELYDTNHKLLTSKDDVFGKVFDRPFKQAFIVPKWFHQYTRSFEGMLDPNLTVPFGDGWKDVSFGNVKEVAFVRIVITKYWGIGGGLNEIQVYGK
jgi:hypothetical protein